MHRCWPWRQRSLLEARGISGIPRHCGAVRPARGRAEMGRIVRLSAKQALVRAMAFVAGASFVSYGAYALLTVRWQHPQAIPLWVWMTIAIPWSLGCIVCGFRTALQRQLAWVIVGGALGTVLAEIMLI